MAAQRRNARRIRYVNTIDASAVKTRQIGMSLLSADADVGLLLLEPLVHIPLIASEERVRNAKIGKMLQETLKRDLTISVIKMLCGLFILRQKARPILAHFLFPSDSIP